MSTAKRLARELHATLKVRFPKAFPADYDAIRPLKVGIEKDIVERLGAALDPVILACTLANHTERAGYLLALLYGNGVRVDLEGQPAGQVDEQAKAVATRKLAAIQQRQQARSARYRQHKARERQLQGAKAERQAERARQAEEKARRRAEQERRRQAKLERQHQQDMAQTTTAKEPSGRDGRAEHGKPTPQITIKKRRAWSLKDRKP